MTELEWTIVNGKIVVLLSAIIFTGAMIGLFFAIRQYRQISAELKRIKDIQNERKK